MTDVVTVIAEMSLWVKSAWLVWLAWLAAQVAWYRWGRLARPDAAASAPTGPVAANRLAPVRVTPHPVDSGGHSAPPSHRRRRRPRREPEVTTDIAGGVEAAS